MYYYWLNGWNMSKCIWNIRFFLALKRARTQWRSLHIVIVMFIYQVIKDVLAFFLLLFSSYCSFFFLMMELQLLLMNCLIPFDVKNSWHDKISRPTIRTNRKKAMEKKTHALCYVDNWSRQLKEGPNEKFQ